MKNKCGEFIRIAHCSTGKHHFAKKILCGEPGCPVCGSLAAARNDNECVRKLEAGVCPDCGAPLAAFGDNGEDEEVQK